MLEGGLRANLIKQLLIRFVRFVLGDWQKVEENEKMSKKNPLRS